MEIMLDIAIIGAGPQGLTLLTHLLRRQRGRTLRWQVFDPCGTWLAQWQRQFAAQDIPHLRSPVVHHPDPNPHALREFAQDRPHELFDPYSRPGTQLFTDFCQAIVQHSQLADRVTATAVTHLEPLGGIRRGFRLTLQAGDSILARRVVLATGDGAPVTPDWVKTAFGAFPPERLCHAAQVNLRSLRLEGERILIIGGGLTSGHLTLGAIRRGAGVTLMTRRSLQERLFDTDPGWIGPKYLKGFWAEPDWQKRSDLIQKARGGGSMTPEIGYQLRRVQRQGNLQMTEQCQVTRLQWLAGHWEVHCTDGRQDSFDRIWYATGRHIDVTRASILASVQAHHPTPVINGLPVLDPYLRWPECELFVMGGLAALQVGPVARNLRGAQLASDRIVAALTKPTLACPSFTPPTPTSA